MYLSDPQPVPIEKIYLQALDAIFRRIAERGRKVRQAQSRRPPQKQPTEPTEDEMQNEN